MSGTEKVGVLWRKEAGSEQVLLGREKPRHIGGMGSHLGVFVGCAAALGLAKEPLGLG